MKKVLIANRGEIAVRIIRACRDYGLTSVSVYADPDQNAPFVAMADEAYGLAGVRPAETYLDIEKLIEIAKRAAPMPSIPATASCRNAPNLPRP